MKKRLAFVAALVLGMLSHEIAWSPPTRAQTAEIPCPAADAIEGQDAQTEPAPEPPLESTDRTTDAHPETVPAAQRRLQLSELLPDPEGADDAGEFIEIENPDDSDAEMDGWVLKTASGKTFVMEGRVAPRGRYAFTYAVSRLPLPNAGSSISLQDPTGVTVDTVTYPGPAKTGKSYARTASDSWQWTTVVTPGSENAFEAAPQPEPQPTPANDSPSETDETPLPSPAGDAPAAPVETMTAALAAMYVRITELLPDPVGSDDGEWIELRNEGGDGITLDGLQLDDADGGSAPYPLDGIRMAGGGYVVIQKAVSGLALNNTGDEVRVLNRQNEAVDSVRYTVAPEGKSYARIDGAWSWTDAPTPGAENFPRVVEEVESAPTQTDPSAQTFEEPVTQMRIDEVGNAADDSDLVAVAGTVTLPPGIIGKRTFAMQDEDAAIIVRAFGNAKIPALIAGDIVRVTGRNRDEQAFSTTGRMIERTGRGEVAYADSETHDLGAEDDGRAVRLRGIVTRRIAKGFIIADDGFGTEAIVRTGARPSATELATGAAVTVRGVIRQRAGRLEVLAATVEKAEPPVVAEERALPTDQERERVTFTAPESSARVPLAAGAAGSTVAVAAVIAFLRRRRDVTNGGLPADG